TVISSARRRSRWQRKRLSMERSRKISVRSFRQQAAKAAVVAVVAEADGIAIGIVVRARAAVKAGRSPAGKRPCFANVASAPKQKQHKFFSGIVEDHASSKESKIS